MTEVAVAIVDAAIESYGSAPISLIEKKSSTAPTPVAWGPEEADFRRHYPCTWHPVIVVVTPGPIPWRPDVAVSGADGLLLDLQLGWRDCYGQADLRESRSRQ